ncbi:thioredoxin [Pseudomonas profundi]|uniref:thioredoxin n=1 Tax=Pseudomonas profundi TaxID=1981513 RepID=UPI001238ECEB|nr:thioredoxin [Pseudomonas profundi]
MSQSPYIFDVTAEDFDRFVLENSFHKPVLVDFWAEWCAPCKALMPVLASIAESLGGELLLAKVDCDAQAALSERFGIRSLPTVVLFKDGQPVDGFAGVQPESAIRTMLAPHITEPAEVPQDESMDVAGQARELIATGAYQQAQSLLQQAIDAQPDDELLVLLAKALVAGDQLDDAEQVIGSVTDKDAHKQAINGLKAQIKFLREAAGFPGRASLEARSAADASDSEASYQLAILDLADGNYESALATLLLLFQTDRGYADNSPQRSMLEVFDLLGNDDPLTIQYRRKMYQALY